MSQQGASRRPTPSGVVSSSKRTDKFPEEAMYKLWYISVLSKIRLGSLDRF